ncbi:hypothetical protein HYQ46_002465 [Verticillium longisporum]|nr:hypothetical protein HYQ46_002465 [Verticillium longisporum]
MVVKRPPSVPGLTERPSSGHSRAQLSDLRMSRARSVVSRTAMVIFSPCSGISPPVLTSLERAAGGEAVDLVGDDVAVGIERGVGVEHGGVGVGIVGALAGEAEGLVLLGRSEELVLLPLADTVLEVGGDEGVAGGRGPLR